MKKRKILPLDLNKEVIHRLDQGQIMGGIVNGGGAVGAAPGGDAAVGFLSIWGSNCYQTNPLKHKCCEGEPTISGACISVNSFHCTEITNC
jgi:hypothetical protein